MANLTPMMILRIGSDHRHFFRTELPFILIELMISVFVPVDKFLENEKY